MDTAESDAFDSYMGGMNSGPRYSGQPNVKPGDGSQGVPGLASEPQVGQRVRHAKSGEGGVVTGRTEHGLGGSGLPTVRWDSMPASGGTNTFDQGYSLDSLTNP